ncbi:hypothetical protein KK101_00445 [Curtobacterium flaccumfaciens pv. oortii]|uniref:hypothetical protein n=1 Tax=Curtobacterium flaccumfaciens TaxID=2035 RepID=UPI001BDEFB9E|nr:hypothetical protein [Curtobacterium flaccumfaciens]MBT1621158.1 hypothetical protein [Curtobacterium flaccumfaciens pv. oortii]
MSSFLDPADAVAVGDATIVPDATRPVAAVVTGDDVRWVTWPGAPLPDGAVDDVRVLATTAGAWVVYESNGDGGDEVSRSAVHVTPTGVTTAVELGDRQPLGADVDGLWIGDPRPASIWAGDDEDGAPDGDADADDSDGHDPLDGIDPETLPWAPAEPFWPTPEAWAAMLATETSAEDDDPELLDDEDEDGPYTWSIGFGDEGEGFVPTMEPLTDPGPPLPTPATDLVLVRPDGSRATITVDHLVEGVGREGSVLAVRYAPTGPRRIPDTTGGLLYTYEYREVDVDLSDGLPTTITTDALPARTVDDEDESSSENERERLGAARAPWIERFDLTGVEGARWPLHDTDESTKEQAVAALVGVFESLAEPGILWTRDHPEPRRAASAYRAVAVVVEGEWPATEVVVSFEHSDVPYLRLRRRYRVFDDAGHVEDWTYVTVYLEEDIATRDIPARDAALDGVLDI